MTLNGIMAVILCYFTELRTFGIKYRYVTVVEVKSMLSTT